MASIDWEDDFMTVTSLWMAGPKALSNAESATKTREIMIVV
jgi:hypothetical protein